MYFLICLLLITCGLFGQERNNNAISVPEGYTRKVYIKNSFSDWIQSLPMKDNRTVEMYNHDSVHLDYYNIYAVVKMPLLFNTDLEQCADFCMRFWAEYHKVLNKLDKLYLFDYSGNKKRFKDGSRSFRSFLKWAFAYSNSYSLKKGCKKITADELVPGDMIVQNETGGIGHVSMIMDIGESKEGKRLYLIGYSFMPAQEFHIEKAQEGYGIHGWFTLKGYYRYLTDFFNFGEPVLRRFEPQ